MSFSCLSAVSAIHPHTGIAPLAQAGSMNILMTKRIVNSVDLQVMDIAQPALLVSTATVMVEINAFGAGQAEWGTVQPVQVMSMKSNL